MSSTSSCDVLVIGAGPAGLAASRVLALAGVTVIVAEQRAFPRDKVGGDALIRDALNGLVCLGVDGIVRRSAAPLGSRMHTGGIWSSGSAPGTRAYAVAQRWAASPSLLNLLPWRAARGTFVQRELERLVAERGDPARLFLLAGC